MSVETVALWAVLAVGALGAAVVVGLGFIAYRSRRSLPYLLVVLALSTVLARVCLGLGYATGWLPFHTHHLVEHALDVVLLALLIGAVLTARRTESTRSTSRSE